MSKEAMKLALEALETTTAVFLDTEGSYGHLESDAMDANYEAITALREALTSVPDWASEAIEKPAPGRAHYEDGGVFERIAAMKKQPAQQEPVAWPCLIAGADFSEDTVTLAMQCTDYKVSAGKHWLSNTPPAQRKPLTDEQIEEIWADCPADWDDKINVLTLARAIEAAHGIKGDA